jgi:hypothetical protein
MLENGDEAKLVAKAIGAVTSGIVLSDLRVQRRAAPPKLIWATVGLAACTIGLLVASSSVWPSDDQQLQVAESDAPTPDGRELPSHGLSAGSALGSFGDFNGVLQERDSGCVVLVSSDGTETPILWPLQTTLQESGHVLSADGASLGRLGDFASYRADTARTSKSDACTHAGDVVVNVYQKRNG